MLKHLKKLWLDTTTNPATGRYSIKRLATFACMQLFIFLVLASVVELHLHGWKEWSMSIREPNIDLIIVLICGALGTSGLTIAGHYFSRKTADANGQPLRPAYDNTDPVTEHEKNKYYDA